ncbi:MAG: TRAP transporter small permease subunit [Gammaproteobacteria bacterium]|nr:TRAP transporter small permease subunit [Gammaproteobacteria bacterium]
MKLHSILDGIDALARRVGLFAAAILIPSLILGRCWEVISRNVFGSVTSSFFNAMEGELFLLLIFLTLGTAYVGDRHVRVDIFRSRMSSRMQWGLELLAAVFFVLPFTLIVIWFGYDLVYSAYQHGERSAAFLGAPVRWLLIFSVPFGITLFALAMFARVLRPLVSPRLPQSGVQAKSESVTKVSRDD